MKLQNKIFISIACLMCTQTSVWLGAHQVDPCEAKLCHVRCTCNDNSTADVAIPQKTVTSGFWDTKCTSDWETACESKCSGKGYTNGHAVQNGTCP